MNDIVKDMQEKVGCEYISDLPSYFYTDYMVCDYGIYHHSVWGYSPTFHD